MLILLNICALVWDMKEMCCFLRSNSARNVAGLVLQGQKAWFKERICSFCF